MVKRLKIPIISALCVLSLAVMCVSLYISSDKNAKFTPPEFDLGAIRGVPDEDVSGWCDATLEGMTYNVFMCREVCIDAEKAIVYFTNPAENTVWLKIRLIDEHGAVIGESGIIKPGEYVEYVSVAETPQNGSKITVKVMGYEPHTYHSAGAVSFNTNVYTDK